MGGKRDTAVLRAEVATLDAFNKTIRDYQGGDKEAGKRVLGVINEVISLARGEIKIDEVSLENMKKVLPLYRTNHAYFKRLGSERAVGFDQGLTELSPKDCGKIIVIGQKAIEQNAMAIDRLADRPYRTP